VSGHAASFTQFSKPLQEKIYSLSESVNSQRNGGEGKPGTMYNVQCTLYIVHCTLRPTIMVPGGVYLGRRLRNKNRGTQQKGSSESEVLYWKKRLG
jgi:hypothetical protein